MLEQHSVEYGTRKNTSVALPLAVIPLRSLQCTQPNWINFANRYTVKVKNCTHNEENFMFLHYIVLRCGCHVTFYQPTRYFTLLGISCICKWFSASIVRSQCVVCTAAQAISHARALASWASPDQNVGEGCKFTFLSEKSVIFCQRYSHALQPRYKYKRNNSSPPTLTVRLWCIKLLLDLA